MTDRIRLRNFKCYEHIDLEFRPLNLLCGLNGMGKSSILQVLLMLRQSYASGELRKGRLVLSGELADLGTGQDVLFDDAATEVVDVELEHAEIGGPCTLSFEYASASDQLQASALPAEGMLERWGQVPPFGGHLIYVNAERIGPRKLYQLSETFARSGAIGLRGEYTLNYLHARQEELLDPADPRVSEGGNRRVGEVVDRWLQEITPGAHLEFDPIVAADALVSGFTFDKVEDVATRRYRATNVGFGLSYVLPVLAGLLAPAEALCLIENPEAHLHPRGQTKLAELAVRAALAGVQVIAETHSDHFMDGVRIAVRDELIAPGQVAFHYFEREAGKAVVTSPQIDGDGRLSAWPAGFFDEHEENMAKLLAPGL